MSRPDHHAESESSPHRFEPGRSFGEFELIELAGRDGPFAIYRARQIKLARLVTLKILVEGPASIERSALLRSEAEEANRLDHAGVVRVFESGSHEGTPFLVMTAIKGELLSERLRFGPLPAILAVDLVRQLAEILAYAHEKGIVHGGIRPAAIWITADRQARLGGFGQLIHYDAADLNALGGFAAYLAPEQAGARGVVGKSTDVYALGAILYAMLTGRPPYRGATVDKVFHEIRRGDAVEPSRIVPTVDQDLDVICAKCMHVNPIRRYGGERPVNRLIADFKRVQAGKSIRSDAPDLRTLARFVFRRNRRVLIAIALIALGVIGPALWDRHRRQAAWEVIASGDVESNNYRRAARYFEQRRLDRPDDREVLTTLALARLRSGRLDDAIQLLSEETSPWPAAPDAATGDDWITLRKLIRLQADLRKGRWTEEQAAVKGGIGKEIAPRTPVEWRLFRECEQLLNDDATLCAAIQRDDRLAYVAAARRPPSTGLIRLLIDKLASGDPTVRLRSICLLAQFRNAALAAEPALLQFVTVFAPTQVTSMQDDPVLEWLGGRTRILFCLAPIKALDAIDPAWTRNPGSRAIMPKLIDALAREPNRDGVAEGLAEAIDALNRIDPNWMSSMPARRHRSTWESWTHLDPAPHLQALGKQILQRLDARPDRK